MSDLDQLRKEMSEQFSSMRSDIKEISTALVELVRLEGKFERVNELVYRVASEVDDLEKRVRIVENDNGVSRTKIGNNERLAWLFLTALVGMVTYFLKTGAS